MIQNTSMIHQFFLTGKFLITSVKKLKKLYDYYKKQDMLFNNKGIDETDNLLTFQPFSLKYSCKTSFLQYHQVLSPIPKQPDTFNKSFFISKDMQ